MFKIGVRTLKKSGTLDLNLTAKHRLFSTRSAPIYTDSKESSFSCQAQKPMIKKYCVYNGKRVFEKSLSSLRSLIGIIDTYVDELRKSKTKKNETKLLTKS